MSLERTFIAAKPDATQRGLLHEVIKRFEERGFRLIAIKMVMATKELLEEVNWKSWCFVFVLYQMARCVIALPGTRNSIFSSRPYILHDVRPNCGHGMGRCRCDQ